MKVGSHSQSQQWQLVCLYDSQSIPRLDKPQGPFAQASHTRERNTNGLVIVPGIHQFSQVS